MKKCRMQSRVEERRKARRQWLSSAESSTAPSRGCSTRNLCCLRDIREEQNSVSSVYRAYATVNDLGPEHRPLLVHMKKVGEDVLQRLHNESTQSGRKLRAGYGFHRPPFNSINHLHLHVFARPRTWRGALEYSGFWFTSMKKLLSNL